MNGLDATQQGNATVERILQYSRLSVFASKCVTKYSYYEYIECLQNNFRTGDEDKKWECWTEKKAERKDSIF